MGRVSEVNLITDRMSGRSRGFAFVTMGTPEAAQAAITALAGKEIQGRALTVNEARPREDHGPAVAAVADVATAVAAAVAAVADAVSSRAIKRPPHRLRRVCGGAGPHGKAASHIGIVSRGRGL